MSSSKSHHLILACSGGPDSVYLLYQLLKKGIRPIVAHLNHQLRGAASEKDEAFVREIAKQNQLRCEVKHCDVKIWAKRNKKSIEEAGRILRYHFLERVRQKHQAQWIVTAHQLNDNLETVLMNQERGSRLRGEIGMREYDPTRHLWRPLLNTPKDKILVYLHRHRIPYRIDTSNEDPHFLRNRIRNKVIPSLLKKNAHLLEKFKKDRAKAIRLYTQRSQKAKQWFGGEYKTFKIKPFLKEKSDFQRFLLVHFYETLYGSTYELKSKYIEEILGLLQKHHTGKEKKFGKLWKVSIQRGHAILQKN